MTSPQSPVAQPVCKQASSYRILIVDDNSLIHCDFKKILCPAREGDDLLDDLEAQLFGSSDRETPEVSFQLDFALQGQDAKRMLEDAIAEGRPYAMAFVDVRMPPGWDGMHTANELWSVYPGLQVVICTAYSDYSWAEMREILEFPESLVVLKKPFDNVEVQQLAHTLCRKWELNLQSEIAIQHLERNIRKLSVPGSHQEIPLIDPDRETEFMISAGGYHFANSLMRLNGAVESTRQQLRQAESQLVQGEKMAALGRLSAGILHEINNPLNYSVAALAVLSKDSKHLPERLQQDHAETLGDLSEGLSRVAEITSSLRMFAHPESSHLKLTSINQSINCALRMMAAELTGGIVVENRVADDLMAMTSGTQLSQVFINLVHNATYALNKKKSIPGETPTIFFESEEHEESVVISVTDNGTGISPENLHKVFDPFYTTKEVGKGTGLGLGICHQILKQFGAEISVQSQQGIFTRFSITLPKTAGK